MQPPSGRRGSPPQVRGKPYQGFAKQNYTRITPAGAGKTDEHNTPNHSAQDHPRRCGENKQRGTGWTHQDGSPPQVRGKHGGAVQGAAQLGITPAGAGKTIVAEFVSPMCRDHPRRCGENLHGLLTKLFRVGSPPQVRGKRIGRPSQIVNPGITPAGAGKTNICFE